MSMQVIHTGRDLTRNTANRTINAKSMFESDEKLVRGIFEYPECPGGTMKFMYKKHKNQPLRMYTMTDGHVYTIPLGVAKHLNNDCWYPKYTYVDNRGTDGLFMEGDGSTSFTKIGKKVRRTGFRSLEFTDDLDLLGVDREIVTAQSVPNNYRPEGKVFYQGKEEADVSKVKRSVKAAPQHIDTTLKQTDEPLENAVEGLDPVNQ